MTNALKSKHKFCFVDGSLTRPKDNTPEVHAWEDNNSMVIAWLYNVIDKTLHGSVAYVKKASDIWTDLKERYSQGNEIIIHLLKHEITLTKQGNSTVSEYFMKLKALWDELADYLQLPTCSCRKDYNFSKHQEAERVHQFLMGLNSDKFGVVRSNILTIEPLPNLDGVYTMIV